MGVVHRRLWRRTTKVLPIHCRYLMGSALSGDDERLRVLLEAWAELPESVKTVLLEMGRGYSWSGS